MAAAAASKRAMSCLRGKDPAISSALVFIPSGSIWHLVLSNEIHMRWNRLTKKLPSALPGIGGALKSSWLAWRMSSHGDSTRSGWGISQQSRGDHQGWAERWSLPWIHKSLNFVIRMDGHIIYRLCLGASHSFVLNHYIRTNMHSCILIVLWVYSWN